MQKKEQVGGGTGEQAQELLFNHFSGSGVEGMMLAVW